MGSRITAPSWRAPAADHPVPELLLPNLLLTAAQTVPLLRRALNAGHWLDAFLLAGALHQLAEERLHPDPFALRRAATHYAGEQGLLAGVVATGAAGAATAATLVRLSGRQVRQLQKDQRAFAVHLAALGEVVMGTHTGAAHDWRAAAQLAARIAVGLDEGDVAHLPACFRDFDQRPADLTWLARAYGGRHPERHRRLAVVGLRTSGTYLAPLARAALQAEGFTDVRSMTLRPGRPLRQAERAVLRAVARDGGHVLVIDDPPGTGGAMDQAADAVRRAGVPPESIVLLVPLFDEADGLPPRLRRWQHVSQPWSAWSVNQQLRESAVRDVLAGMLGAGQRIVAIDRVRPPVASRGHAEADFDVRVEEASTGAVRTLQIVVEGAGLGYLGRHAIAVANALEEFVPRVYGLQDGLLYRDRLTARAWCTDQVIEAVVDYTDARRRRLPVERAPGQNLTGRHPAWQVAARLLGRLYGPLAPLAQVTLLEPITRRLLTVEAPCVIDGDTDLHRWADRAAGGPPLKTKFHQRSFSHLELQCFDPVFDLAGAALPPVSSAVGADLRAAFRRRSGQDVDHERWMLYQLTLLWRLDGSGELPPGERAGRQARVVNEYLAATYLHDVAPAPDGPACALDLDGVLESDPLGFRATTPAGALALRALIRHGYRPVIATGRSLPEVIERAELFALAGGIAEYGAVLFTRADGEVVDLRPQPAREALDRVRDVLLADPRLRVDLGHRFSVRVRQVTATGRWGPLTGGLPQAALAAAGGEQLTLVHGQDQTDIITPHTDKGTGLRALGERLGLVDGYAFAVGDTAQDLPMLAMARLARAPRNADVAVRSAGVRLTRHEYQAGLFDACTDLLGHPPGRCPECRLPPPAARTRAVLTVLGLREAGLSGLPRRTAGLLYTARIARRTAPDPSDLGGPNNGRIR